jgi:hypothetical protein
MQERAKQDETEAKSEEPPVSQFDAFARNMVRLFDEGAKVLGTLAERGNGVGPYSMATEAGEATKLLGEIARQWVSSERAVQGLHRTVGPIRSPFSR